MSPADIAWSLLIAYVAGMWVAVALAEWKERRRG